MIVCLSIRFSSHSDQPDARHKTILRALCPLHIGSVDHHTHTHTKLSRHLRLLHLSHCLPEPGCGCSPLNLGYASVSVHSHELSPVVASQIPGPGSDLSAPGLPVVRVSSRFQLPASSLSIQVPPFHLQCPISSSDFDFQFRGRVGRLSYVFVSWFTTYILLSPPWSLVPDSLIP
ncbi:hypothetical protein B0H66DRAFT_542364 [Apodospora peruviana]|uniref:Uncharacterized protein n=1 Tax=Apodospora peruviana TaxID=516989 RepID=A0AAE0IRF3_9PEZI|nr:hypothetical protein B0H66DRAFT_542364 [Apodospora peruviana]